MLRRDTMAARLSTIALIVVSLVLQSLPVRGALRVEGASAIATTTAPCDTVTVPSERSDGWLALGVRSRPAVPLVSVAIGSLPATAPAHAETAPDRPRARSHPHRRRP